MYNFDEWYKDLSTLTQNEYEQAKQKAKKVVQKRIGNKPTKKEFRRETKKLFTPTAILAIIVLLTVYAISAIEQWVFMGNDAHNSLAQPDYMGIPLNPFVVTVIFQIGVSLMTEFSMILFMVRWRMKVKSTPNSNMFDGKYKNGVYNWFIQFFDINFFLAMLSMCIVLYINMTSDLFILIGVAVPLFTIGIGFIVEEIISEYLIEETRVHQEYTQEYNMWKVVESDETKHPDWKPILYQSIWDSIVNRQNRYNKGYDVDVVGSWKAQAVEKELERDEWSTQRVQTKQITDESGLTLEELKGLSEPELLLKMMDSWKEGQNPVIGTENYTVNMETFLFDSEFEEPYQYTSVAYLKNRVKRLINKRQ